MLRNEKTGEPVNSPRWEAVYSGALLGFISIHSGPLLIFISLNIAKILEAYQALFHFATTSTGTPDRHQHHYHWRY